MRTYKMNNLKLIYIRNGNMSDNNHNLSQSYWYTIIAEAISYYYHHITTLCYICSYNVYLLCMYVHTYIYCMYVCTYIRTVCTYT